MCIPTLWKNGDIKNKFNQRSEVNETQIKSFHEAVLIQVDKFQFEEFLMGRGFGDVCLFWTLF